MTGESLQSKFENAYLEEDSEVLATLTTLFNNQLSNYSKDQKEALKKLLNQYCANISNIIGLSAILLDKVHGLILTKQKKEESLILISSLRSEAFSADTLTTNLMIALEKDN